MLTAAVERAAIAKLRALKSTDGNDHPLHFLTHSWSRDLCSDHAAGSVPVSELLWTSRTDKNCIRAQDPGRVPVRLLLDRSITCTEEPYCWCWLTGHAKCWDRLTVIRKEAPVVETLHGYS